MILRLTYEELTALNSAVERIRSTGGGGVAAPPEVLAVLDERAPIEGDVSVDTFAEQRRLLDAIDTVLEHLRNRMDAIILDQYVGSDDAVNAYFDYANVFTARDRLEELGRKMAVDELINGEDAASDDANGVGLPD